MRKAVVVIAVGLLTVSCLSKPEPWTPEGDIPVAVDLEETAHWDAGPEAKLPEIADSGTDLPSIDQTETMVEEVGVETQMLDSVAELDIQLADLAPDGDGEDIQELVDVHPDTCQPDCAGKECGEDGCGENCGTCPGAAPACYEGLCCTPQCEGKDCGDDGCGGTCGTCQGELACQETGLCNCDAGSLCGQFCCQDGQECLEDESCCTPGCFGFECGLDECGNPCGDGCLGDCWCEDNMCKCDCPVEGDCDEGIHVCLEDGKNYHPCVELEDCPDIWQIDEAAIFECPVDFEACIGGQCYGQSESCEDDDECTENLEEIWSSQCLNPDKNCDDGNPDTMDWCDIEIGCKNLPLNCIPEDPAPCTDYWKDELSGDCMEAPKNCDDDDLCTEGDYCDQDTGDCGHVPVFCPDGSVCVDDGSCCTIVCDGKTCGDDNCGGDCGQCDSGWECTQDGQCQWGGDCTDNEGADCDDGNPCSLNESCMAGKCVGTANCDDQNPCTVVDTCVDGLYCQHQEVDCDDNNECTLDWCDPQSVQCQYDLIPGSCDDGNPCTINDVCLESKVCQGEEDQIACDWDHDGIPDVQDNCPYLYSQIQVESAFCPPADDAYALSRPLLLSESGLAPATRRTFQPVDIPLANGLADASLAGLWKLDDGAAADSSGHGNGGVLSSTPPTAFNGAFQDENGGLSFNGLTTNVTLAGPEGTGLDLADNRTLSVWFNVKMHIDGRRLWDDQSQAGAYRLQLGAGGSVMFLADAELGTADAYCGVVEPQQWHHVAVTLDGARLKCYLDGVLQGTAVLNDMVTGDTGTVLGSAVDGTSFFSGMLDEVILASRPWKPDEVRSYYLSGAPFGTRLVPGAQRDFDDVRVTQDPGLDGGGEFYTATELVGLRPHSDSPGMDQGLVAHWAFDGGYADLQNGYVAAADAGVSLVNGRFGEAQGAIRFDAGADAAVVGNDPAFAFANGSQTLETWFRGDALGDGIVYFIDKKHSATSNAYALGYATNKLYCEYKSPGEVVTVLGETDVTDSEWHHAGCVFDRDRQKAYVYLDGLVDGESEIPAGFGSMQHADPLRLGIGAAALLVEIDEVLIHDVARSHSYFYDKTHPSLPTIRFLASTVREPQNGLYPYHGYTLRWGRVEAQPAFLELPDPQGGESCFGLLSACSGWLGWWRFEEGEGNMAVDSTANGNHGKFYEWSAQLSSYPSVTSYDPAPDGLGAAFYSAFTHVRVPDSDTLRMPVDEFTIEASARLDQIWEGPGGNERSMFVHRGACPESGERVSYQLGVFGTDGGVGPIEQDSNLAVTTPQFQQFSPINSYKGDGLWHSYSAAVSPDSIELAADEDSWSYTPVMPPDTICELGRPLYIGALGNACSDAFSAPVRGTLGQVRLMGRALHPDELLAPALPDWSFGTFALDADQDGVPLAAGLPVCQGGQYQGCSDNCPETWNPYQEDGNSVGSVGNACCVAGQLGDWSHCLQIDLSGGYPDGFAHKVPFELANAPAGFLAGDGADLVVADAICGVCYPPGLEPTVYPHWLDNWAGATTANLFFNTGTDHPTSVAVYYVVDDPAYLWNIMDVFDAQVPAVQLAYSGDVEGNGHFTDSSGYGRHGQPSFDTASGPDGVFGQCIDTKNGYVLSPDVVLSAGIPASFSVSAWVQVPNTGKHTIVSEYGTPYSKGRFYLTTMDSRIRFARQGAGTTVYTLETGNSVFPDMEWFHLGASYSGAEDVLRIYINGVQQSGNTGNELAPSSGDSVKTRIGAGKNATDLLVGKLDDLTLHSQKLQLSDFQMLAAKRGHATPAQKGNLLIHKANPAPTYTIQEVF